VSAGQPSQEASPEQRATSEASRAVDDAARGPIIDVEYRVVS
jgi:hypothetical protein